MGWRRQVFGLCVVGIVLLNAAVTAWGHIDVSPRQSTPRRWETYAMKVPTETASSTIKVHVLVPREFEIEMVEHSRVWQVDTVRDARGFVREITWSGSKIPPQTFEHLRFLAKNPAAPGLYKWAITQTYQAHNPGKWTAQTRIVADTNASTKRLEEAWRTAQVATTVSLVALGISLTLIVLMVVTIVQSGRRQMRDFDV